MSFPPSHVKLNCLSHIPVLITTLLDHINGLGRDLEPTTYNNFKHQKPTVKFDIKDVCPGELFKGSITVTGSGIKTECIPPMYMKDVRKWQAR